MYGALTQKPWKLDPQLASLNNKAHYVIQLHNFINNNFSIIKLKYLLSRAIYVCHQKTVRFYRNEPEELNMPLLGLLLGN